MRWLFWRRQRPSDFERGVNAARAFLARNPSAAEIESYWSCACVDEAFSSDPDYARGVKATLRSERDRLKNGAGCQA